MVVSLVSHLPVTRVFFLHSRMCPQSSLHPTTRPAQAPSFLFFFFFLSSLKTCSRIPHQAVSRPSCTPAPPSAVCKQPCRVPQGVGGQVRNTPSQDLPLWGEDRPPRLSLRNPCDCQSACLLPGEDQKREIPHLLSGARPPGKGQAPHLENRVTGHPARVRSQGYHLWFLSMGKQTSCGKPHGLFQEAFVCPPRQALHPPLRKHFPRRLVVSA